MAAPVALVECRITIRVIDDHLDDQKLRQKAINQALMLRGCRDFADISSNRHRSELRTDHKFLDGRLRCDPVIRIRRSGMINHQAENLIAVPRPLVKPCSAQNGTY
jgi:hypothetical protein